MPKAFISYSHKDRPFARQLQKYLEAEGITVCIDDKDFNVGESIPEKIGNAINTSDFVIPILSATSVKSSWVLIELKLAITKEVEQQKVSVLPVKIQDCVVPNFLKDKIYSDFTDPKDFHTPFRRLLISIIAANELDRCEYCKNTVPLTEDLCPHCARPASPPNVRAAKNPSERAALNERYLSAIDDARSRGCEKVVHLFELAVAQSKVVISLDVLSFFIFLLDKSFDFRSRFVGDIQTGRADARGKSGKLPNSVDFKILFPGYSGNLRFGILSLNGAGLSTLGKVSLVLREDLIAYRASVFEDNSLLFVEQRKLKIGDKVPPGFRATWNERAKLCVSKLAHELTSETQPSEFPNILLRQGKAVKNASFIEVHIWGAISHGTIERVTMPRRAIYKCNALLKVNGFNAKLHTVLNQFGIELEVR